MWLGISLLRGCGWKVASIKAMSLWERRVLELYWFVQTKKEESPKMRTGFSSVAYRPG